MRLQSGRQKLTDAVTFRRRIQDALQDAQRDATVAGYSSRTIRDAEAAVVAFLDETVISLAGPGREVWAQQTLSVQLYGEGNAGEVFFDRLEEIKGQTDSPILADTLEVFLICLLLGFEGRYAGRQRLEVNMIADRIRSRIEGIRGAAYPLSPPFRFAESSGTVVEPPRPQTTWLWWLAGCVVTPFLLFLLFKINLSSALGTLDGMLAGVR
ncbi:MAG: DotU family type IV/VI secretion system protein [Acidobacteriaceae bacterium]|nr:DotU family type IV/VI secretion system protein [Acidobacteriaceae bacterium]